MHSSYGEKCQIDIQANNVQYKRHNIDTGLSSESGQPHRQFHQARQNYSFDELWEFIQTNPRNGLSLDKPEYINTNTTATPTLFESEQGLEHTKQNAFGLNGFQFHFLKPSGLLSVFTYIHSPLFRAAPLHLAKAIRLEFGTEFITNLETNIQGSRFMRKRRAIQEWMNTLMNLPGILTNDVEIAVRTLCQVQGFQAILVSNFTTEFGKEQTTQPRILFSSDPANWTTSSPTWIFDINGSWILEQLTADESISLSSWIEDREQAGWIIEWPVVDADTKKTDMIDVLKESIFWTSSDEKLKKDVLAPRYSRYRALKGLRNISYGGVTNE